MLKGLLVSSAFVAISLSAVSAQAASLQEGRSTSTHHRYYGKGYGGHHGISYGVGGHPARTTATGGNPGGYSGRN